jgi:hypothetical protein
LNRKGVLEIVMSMARYKTIIVVLLMLVFTGQVLASANMFCQGDSSEQMMSSSMSDHMSMSDHAMHTDMDATLTDSSDGFGCCLNADCDLGGCTVAAVMPSVQPLFTSTIVALVSYPHVIAVNQQVSSLFRPPISR